MEGTNSIHKPQNNLDIPTFNASQMASPSSSPYMRLSPENNSNKRPGIPPSHPNNPAAPSPYSRHIGGSSPNAQHGAPGHSRSLSQPTFFSLDGLPPWCPPPYPDPSPLSLSDPASNDVSMEERVVNSNVRSSLPSPVAGGSNEFLIKESSSLPPRKGHRRSNSDVPLGFSTMIQSSPQLVPIGQFQGGIGSFGAGKPIQLVKRESEWKKDCGSNVEVSGERKSEGDIADDLFNAYMNLENLETLNSSGTEDKDLDSKASGTKTYGCESSDNEVDSTINKHPITKQGMSSGVLNEKREGVNKRRAAGDIAPTVRHYRSVSMDSYMGSLQFDEDTLKIPPLENHGNHHSPGSSADANSSKFNFEIGSNEFNESELKKIMENEKLAEMASVDPKRVKRILANRQSAARSKQRKMQYIVELEQKVQTLQTETTTLSAQITMLQRDFAGLSSQNNELKFRLQAMEQQAQLKDALNEALAAEAQRLKLTAAEFSGEAHLSNCMAQQLSINHPMLQLQPQQYQQLNVYQMQQQPQNSRNDQSQTQQQNGDAAANESK
ncbi:DRINK ME-LIKE, basic leucine-zipper 29 [Hibiscus trionum]|uniref:DRINK ME-LIKE, basic leucine-zipper 29 n=1 Tax=Hibiscus trionum TaxID=183268 RepID=A0A9W7HKJ4_HIBTR|nr:DRINK ME-LIKE, basic leucine-zipper 29 [Hibiscus trionum]